MKSSPFQTQWIKSADWGSNLPVDHRSGPKTTCPCESCLKPLIVPTEPVLSGPHEPAGLLSSLDHMNQHGPAGLLEEKDSTDHLHSDQIRWYKEMRWVNNEPSWNRWKQRWFWRVGETNGAELFNDVSSPDRGGLVLLVVTQRSSESVWRWRCVHHVRLSCPADELLLPWSCSVVESRPTREQMLLFWNCFSCLLMIRGGSSSSCYLSASFGGSDAEQKRPSQSEKMAALFPCSSSLVTAQRTERS